MRWLTRKCARIIRGFSMPCCGIRRYFGKAVHADKEGNFGAPTRPECRDNRKSNVDGYERYRKYLSPPQPETNSWDGDVRPRVCACGGRIEKRRRWRDRGGDACARPDSWRRKIAWRA